MLNSQNCSICLETADGTRYLIRASDSAYSLTRLCRRCSVAALDNGHRDGMIVAVVAKWADAHRIVEALTGEPPNDGDVHDPDKLPGVTIASGGPVGIPPRTPPAEPGPGTRLVYSAKEAAKALNLSESKTRELCYRKKLKSIKEGRRLLIPEWALREYVSGGSTYVEDLETQIDNRTI